MTTIEPLDCDVCHRRIGPQRTHYITETNRVVCGDCCVFSTKSTTPAHALLYPDCPVSWHDLWDHQFI